MNTAAAGFADDCGAAAAGEPLEALTHRASIDDGIVNSALDNINLKQNIDKIAKQTKLLGEGSKILFGIFWNSMYRYFRKQQRIQSQQKDHGMNKQQM